MTSLTRLWDPRPTAIPIIDIPATKDVTGTPNIDKIVKTVTRTTNILSTLLITMANVSILFSFSEPISLDLGLVLR